MGDGRDLPVIGTGAGPQMVITRMGDAEQQIEVFADFEAAAEAWMAGRRAYRADDDYGRSFCIWVNDGTIWRASGLLNNLGRAKRVAQAAAAQVGYHPTGRHGADGPIGREKD